MKRPSCVRLARLTVSFAIPLLLSPQSSYAATKETVTVTVNQPLVFPPKPDAITSVFTVGSPELNLPAEIGSRLGGTASGELMKAPFEGLLHNSGRFQVLVSGHGPYRVLGSISGFELTKGSQTSALSKSTKWLTDKFRKDVPQLDGTDIALYVQNEESRLAVKCSVVLQLIDATSTAMLESENATVTLEKSLKEMRVELGGVDITNKGPAMEVLAQYNTRIIELALHAALVKMVPRLDARLAKPQPPAASVKELTKPVESIDSAAKTIDSAAKTTPRERLKEFKLLLDEGLITQEEFDQKKKEILATL